ncbi:uncharacterized protein LOC143251770 [Tachypleus tridentatus]|uniref:uncharacterized protein LOC143251770 n=1 Tax=Tachypleus tridentatus TaxID=6853 RepID=UPI003FD19232
MATVTKTLTHYVTVTSQRVTSDIRITFEDALKNGLIDETRGTFKEPKTGEIMPLEEAFNRGILELPSERVTETSEEISAYPTETFTKTIRRTIITHTEEPSPSPEGESPTKETPKVESLSPEKTSFVTSFEYKPKEEEPELTRGREPLKPKVSAEEPDTRPSVVAFQLGKPETQKIPEEFASPTEQVTISTRMLEETDDERSRDYITTVKGIVNPKTRELLTMAEAIRLGILNIESAQYTDVRSGKLMNLPDAVSKGLIDDDFVNRVTESCGIIDLKTGVELTLIEAIQKGLFDPDKGHFLDPKNGRPITFAEAVRMGVITEDGVRR